MRLLQNHVKVLARGAGWMSKEISEYDELFCKLFPHCVSSNLENTTPFIVGISGPPASGKSTLSERIVSDLLNVGVNACFCPMDGFHLSNSELDILGLRSVKGRIDTFNANEFVSALKQLKNKKSFWWPTYSRIRHNPIAEGIYISGTEAVYIIEGNYLLETTEPWNVVKDYLDISIFVDMPDNLLHQRLLKRHKKSGRSELQAIKKIKEIDMPNAENIRINRQTEDIFFYENSNDM